MKELFAVVFMLCLVGDSVIQCGQGKVRNEVLRRMEPEQTWMDLVGRKECIAALVWGSNTKEAGCEPGARLSPAMLTEPPPLSPYLIQLDKT